LGWVFILVLLNYRQIAGPLAGRDPMRAILTPPCTEKPEVSFCISTLVSV
jgi:hypothetical protein